MRFDGLTSGWGRRAGGRAGERRPHPRPWPRPGRSDRRRRPAPIGQANGDFFVGEGCNRVSLLPGLVVGVRHEGVAETVLLFVRR